MRTRGDRLTRERALRDFAGKVAVVTGAANGIGRAFAVRFATEGMKVVLADVEAPALDVAVQELTARELDVVGVLTDVASAESVEKLAREALDAYGAVHILCSNAGVLAAPGHGLDRRSGHAHTALGTVTAGLAVDVRGEPLGRGPRHQELHSDHARAGRTGPCRQHCPPPWG